MSVQRKISISLNIVGAVSDGTHELEMLLEEGLTVKEALQPIKAVLMDRGLPGPYRFLYNGRFALAASETHTVVSEGGVFTVLPVMGGG
jgi:sulfur carrier protein ThiS